MALREQWENLRELGPRTATFVGEVWAEMKKVHWPTQKETYAATVVVLVVCIVVAIFLGIVDFAVSHMIHAVLS